MNETLLKAAGLWERTSANGRRYMSGRLGGVKVVILENTKRETDRDPSHHLFFAEAPEKPSQSAAGQAGQAPTYRQRTSQRARKAAHDAFAPTGNQSRVVDDLNDEVGF